MKELERARWRCRRGMLELDIVLQRFIDNNYEQLSTQQLKQFEQLLDLPDHDLWDLITGRQATSDESLSTVLNLLQKN
jgi:antitoxin CptB